MENNNNNSNKQKEEANNNKPDNKLQTVHPENCKWTKKSNFRCKWRYLLLLTSLCLIIIDHITKFVVKYYLHFGEVKTVIAHYWNWTLVYNKGAAFSFLDNDSSWPRVFFGVVAFVVSVWLVHYILNKTYSIVTGIALSFILGGAIGNLIDRIAFGKVTDFIQWHYNNYYWPAFNVADSCIFIGVALLIVEGLCKRNAE